MVHGLEKFKEYFEDHTNQYVFIGGTAFDILLDELEQITVYDDRIRIIDSIVMNSIF